VFGDDVCERFFSGPGMFVIPKEVDRAILSGYYCSRRNGLALCDDI